MHGFPLFPWFFYFGNVMSDRRISSCYVNDVGLLPEMLMLARISAK